MCISLIGWHWIGGSGMAGEREEKLTFVIVCAANEITSFLFLFKLAHMPFSGLDWSYKDNRFFDTFWNIEKGIFTHTLSAINVVFLRNFLVLINTIKYFQINAQFNMHMSQVIEEIMHFRKCLLPLKKKLFLILSNSLFHK